MTFGKNTKFTRAKPNDPIHRFDLLTSPRGITAARPPCLFSAIVGRAFVFHRSQRFLRSILSAAALGALHVVLGRSWLLLGFLERTWPNLAAKTVKNDPQMASWEPLGASWAPFGPTWRWPKPHKNKMPKKDQLPDPSMSNRPPHLGGFGVPKSIKNATQDESKIQPICKSEKIALQEPLGAVLGRSWGILGGILGPNVALRYTRACVS